jgi:H+/Cl- antiporter ClcA
LSGIFLHCLPFSPRNIIRHLFHDLIELDYNSRPLGGSIAMILASWIVLVAGAPLGPELALGALASMIVSLVSKKIWILSGGHSRQVSAKWAQTCLAGALAPIFPSWVSSVLAIQELVLSARPHNVTIDATIRKHSSQNREVITSAQGFDDNQLEEPLMPSLPPPAAEAHPRQLSAMDHDFMELLLLSSSTAVVSFLVHQFLADHLHVVPFQWDSYRDLLEPAQKGEVFSHYLLAVPLGVLGGLIGSVTITLSIFFQWIGSRICHFLSRHQQGLPIIWFVPVLFSTFAGLVIACLTLLLPLEPWMIMDNGFYLMLHLLKKDNQTTVLQLITLATCKLVCVAVALGLGWVGGPLFPLAAVGVCVGLVLSELVEVLPTSLTVPCCMAAIVGSAIPIPFTIIVTLTHIFSLHMGQAGPILIAVVVAYSVTGGLGLIRCVGLNLAGIPSGNTTAQEEEDERADQLLTVPSDDELLHEVRSAIFGPSNPCVKGTVDNL